MGERATFTKREIDRAVSAVQERGLSVQRVTIRKDGEIVVDCGPISPADDFDLTDMRR